MRRRVLFVYLAGLCLVIAIFVAVFLILENRKVLIVKTSEISTIESHGLPGGVRVVEEGERRILRDRKTGYEIEIPKEAEVEVQNNSIVLYYADPDTPEYRIMGAIITAYGKDGLSLEQWVSRRHTEEPFIFYEDRKIIDKGSLEIIKIPVDGPGIQYEYFMPVKDKILEIHSLGDEFFDDAIQNSMFITQ